MFALIKSFDGKSLIFWQRKVDWPEKTFLALLLLFPSVLKSIFSASSTLWEAKFTYFNTYTFAVCPYFRLSSSSSEREFFSVPTFWLLAHDFHVDFRAHRLLNEIEKSNMQHFLITLHCIHWSHIAHTLRPSLHGKDYISHTYTCSVTLVYL